MIVSIGLGDEGVNVCLDDGISDYNPIRLVEMANTARKLFAEVYTDTLSEVTDALVDEQTAGHEGDLPHP